jgi:hypothetical protein
MPPPFVQGVLTPIADISMEAISFARTFRDQATGGRSFAE